MEKDVMYKTMEHTTYVYEHCIEKFNKKLSKIICPCLMYILMIYLSMKKFTWLAIYHTEKKNGTYK